MIIYEMLIVDYPNAVNSCLVLAFSDLKSLVNILIDTYFLLRLKLSMSKILIRLFS